MSDSPKILWARCLAIIQNNVNEQQYSTWFAPIKFKSFDAQAKSLVIYIPSQFYYEYLEEHFRVLMHRAIYRIYGEGVENYMSIGGQDIMDERAEKIEAATGYVFNK